eukprot:142567_1
MSDEYWSFLFELLIYGYVRRIDKNYKLHSAIPLDLCPILIQFHSHSIDTDTKQMTIFNQKCLRCYGRICITDSRHIGIVSMKIIDEKVIVIDSDSCVHIYNWNKNTLSIEKTKPSSILNKIEIKNTIKEPKILNNNLCFQITKNGAYIVVAGFDYNSFYLWDIINSKTIQCIEEHKDIVSCMSLDENILVTGSYDKSIVIWNIKDHCMINNQPICILKNEEYQVIAVDISLKSGLIAYCLLNGTVKVYDTTTLQQISEFQPWSNNNSLKIIIRVSKRFGHILCYSQTTRQIFLYSSVGTLVNSSTSQHDIYYDIKFSQCGKYIVCGGENGILRIKKLPSFKTRKKFSDIYIDSTISRGKIMSIYLDEKEQAVFVGLSNGDILVYRKLQSYTLSALTELGF